MPGLFVAAQSVENVSLNLRGLTSDTDDPRVQPQVSVFQDGVVLANSHGNSVALFDVDNVAVFKGPQPTQFSRGISGGAMAVTSNRAVNARSGILTFGVGDRRAMSAEAVINQPIVPEKLFARFAAYASRREGYVENLAGGAALQGEGTRAFRASLRWQPALATTADLIFNYQRDDTPGIAIKSMAGVPGLAPVTDLNPYTPANLNRGSELGVTRTILSATAIASHRLNDAWTFAATAGWREVESNNEFDADGSFHYLIEAGERFHARQLSQEVRLTYDRNSRLAAMAGATVFGSKDEEEVIIRSDENNLWRFFTRTPPPVSFNPRYVERNAIGAGVTAGDVFGRVESKFTDRLTVGAGLRLTAERLVSRFQSFAATPRGNLVGLLPTSGGANDLFQNTNGRLEKSIDVRSWSGQLDGRYAITPQLSAYATVSRGRRPPVQEFDLRTFAPLIHAEETVWNYEAGLKGATASRRFQYAASVFQYDFEHFQTQHIVPPGVIQPFDGGRARGRGLEATLQAELVPELTAFATYGFTDAKFSATGGNGTPQLFAGDTFRLTSRHVVSLGGTVSWVLAEKGTVFATPLFTYRSACYFEDNNAQNGGILRQGGYGLANLRFGYRAPGGRWEVTAYANNLFDKKYLLDAGNVGGGYGIPTDTPAAPRTVGLNTIVRF